MSEFEERGDYGVAASRPRRSSAKKLSEAGAAEEIETDSQFVDDLVAANRFKTFLVGRGVDVPERVLEGLGGLMTQFKDSVKTFQQFADEESRMRKGIWRG